MPVGPLGRKRKQSGFLKHLNFLPKLSSEYSTGGKQSEHLPFYPLIYGVSESNPNRVLGAEHRERTGLWGYKPNIFEPEVYALLCTYNDGHPVLF